MRLWNTLLPRGIAAALLLTALAHCQPAGAMEITKCLAIATADSVRAEVTVNSSAPEAEVELFGRIAPMAGGAALWEGSLGKLRLSGIPAELVHTISNLKPQLWDLTSPTLYNLEVTARRGGQTLAAKTVRFGFRSFEARDGQFHLNGRPIFLRGLAINPPGRTIPDAVGESRAFAEAYVRFLKSQNLNIFRITIDESQVWFEVCDELGMLMYAGRYGAPPGVTTGKKVAPTDHAEIITGYRQLLERFASHPSIVMYLLANELPVSGERGAAFSELLTRAHDELRRWDNTRPYIGNAGYGEGREGDVCDVHRYWGWYYNSFLTFYNLRDRLYPQPLYGAPVKNQPLTFTECVGSFTGSSGEFNVVRSKQLAPRLGWIGHTETPQEDALRYQSFMVKQACESFRRMRPLNPRLAGLMPFTILFYNWAGIASFDDMQPKPAMDQMRMSYQPVLLSWELWTPQVYAGTELRPIAHVINDDDRGRALSGAKLNYSVQGKDGRRFAHAELPLPDLAYFGTWSKPLSLALPADMPTGEYLLTGSVTTPAGVVSTNFESVFIADRDWKQDPLKTSQPVLVYDPPWKTAAALGKLGVRFQRLENLAKLPGEGGALVIGEHVWNESLTGAKAALNRFVAAGGRVLCLQQKPETFDATWLPAKVSFFTSSPNDTDYPPRTRPFREQMNINPARPDHPVFAGLHRDRLRLWSDYTGWDQTKPGFPSIYPVTTGFKLDEAEALAHTAILADYDRGLEGIALCEMFAGKGSVILSGFDLVNRASLDPAAARLLANLVAYAATPDGHEIHPLVNAPIRWGDFPTERGTVCGSLNGLLPNTEWIPAPNGPASEPLPPNTGAWNMMPGDQFVPRGRHPFGPYGYSTASSLRLPKSGAETGSGFFWARIPAGKEFVVTTVRNPAQTSGTLEVAINDAPAGASASIAAGQSATIRSRLPARTTLVCVRYTGSRALVLVETVFE